jgi:two-component system sensor histidine kinase YesM
MLVDFNYSLLSDFTSYKTSSENNSSERLIIDFEGNVLYSRNRGKLTISVDEAIQEAVGNADCGFRRIMYNNRNYYMTYARYQELGWTFIDLNPVSKVSEHLWLRSPFMAICIFALPVLLFAYLAISYRLLKPINELTTVISDYESQLPGISDQPRLLSGNAAHTGMNTLSDIDLLINKIYSIKLKQKEAELNSLQNQINPHFLYNTLESIRGAALYHGIHDIAAMSKALSLLFRYSISERVLVSIKEELQHLDNYLSIQNFRYENKFELLYSIPPELMDYKILKLTLQPLIENSIKHGLEMKLGKGTVKIEILALENNIKIQISDDGLGMPPKKVEELNRSLSNGKYHPESEGCPP